MLNDQQKQVIESTAAGLAVTACPGSGKTRTLVELFIQASRCLTPQQGVAAVSFTNVAADEVRKRCHELGTPWIPQFPNFVGSLDSFIFRYAVMPFGSPWSRGTRLRLLESWSRIDKGVTIGGAPISLDYFHFDKNEYSQINWHLLPQALHAVAHANPEKLCRAASASRLSWLRRGYLSCADARLISSMILGVRENAVGFARLMKSRFKHILVDEAQDCNKHDVEFIKFLFLNNVKVTLFFDPDQSIYEFRGSLPGEISSLVSDLPQAIRLSNNYRSSQNICNVATSMRGSSEQRDLAAGVNAASEIPVYIIPYDGKVSDAIGRDFCVLAGRHTIPLDECVVLSHSHLNTFRAVGGVLEQGASLSTIGRIASAVRPIFQGETGRKLLESAREISTLLLDRMGIKDERVLTDRERVFLRTQALRVLGLLGARPVSCDPAWVDFVRGCFEAAHPLPTRSFAKSVKLFISYNKTMKWPTYSAVRSVDLRATTIHQVKGQEFEAVALVLVNDTAKREVIAHWRNRVQDSEGRRVLYVGATRARRLLALAVPQALVKDILGLCQRDGAKVITMLR